MRTRHAATIEDLYRVPEDGKAELVNGELVLLGHTGYVQARASAMIAISLREYERSSGGGLAYGDNVGFIVDLPHRKSLCPNAAFHTGRAEGLKFPEGAPVFAVEVRSEHDYGPTAEREMAAKRADYFAAGTLVVWDVDLLDAVGVRVYRASDPHTPTGYRRGEVAEAEPAVPGWSMPVNELFL